MAIFIQEVPYENGDVASLVVPQGHSWRVLAIGEAGVSDGSRVRITYATPGGQRAIYSRSFQAQADPDAPSGRTIGLAIGAPFSTTSSLGGEGDTSGTINEPLPDITLPSHCVVGVEIDDPDNGVVVFLIED